MVSFTLSLTHAHKYHVWPNSLSIITLGDAENNRQQLFNKSQRLSSFLDQSSCAGFGCAFCIRSWQLWSSASLFCPTPNHNTADGLTTHLCPHLDHHTVPVMPLFFLTSSLKAFNSFFATSTPIQVSGETACRCADILVTNWSRHHQHMPAFCPFCQHFFQCSHMIPFIPHSYQS